MPIKSASCHSSSTIETSARKVVKTRAAVSGRAQKKSVSSVQITKANKAMLRAWKKIAARA